MRRKEKYIECQTFHDKIFSIHRVLVIWKSSPFVKSKVIARCNKSFQLSLINSVDWYLVTKLEFVVEKEIN